jgi:hypothetical protein
MPSVIPAIQRLRSNARYHGWLAAFQILAVTILRKFMKFERIHLYQLEKLPSGMLFPSGDVARLATADEVKTLARDPAADMTDFTEAKIDELFAQGHRCVFNLDRGRVVGYSWMRFDRIEIPALGAGFECRPDEGYIYKGLTLPDVRGKGVANERFLCWLDYLRHQGRRSAVTYFAFDNKATLARVRKLDMGYLGTATRIKIGSFDRLWLSGDYRGRKRYPL